VIRGHDKRQATTHAAQTTHSHPYPPLSPLPSRSPRGHVWQLQVLHRDSDAQHGQHDDKAQEGGAHGVPVEEQICGGAGGFRGGVMRSVGHGGRLTSGVLPPPPPPTHPDKQTPTSKSRQANPNSPANASPMNPNTAPLAPT